MIELSRDQEIELFRGFRNRVHAIEERDRQRLRAILATQRKVGFRMPVEPGPINWAEWDQKEMRDAISYHPDLKVFLHEGLKCRRTDIAIGAEVLAAKWTAKLRRLKVGNEAFKMEKSSQSQDGYRVVADRAFRASLGRSKAWDGMFKAMREAMWVNPMYCRPA